MSFARSLSQVTELKGVLKMCQTMHAAMSHFVNQIQYYFVFEVLECSWHELLKAVETAEDLDQLIKASQTTKEALSLSTSNNVSKTKPGLFRVWMVCYARPQIWRMNIGASYTYGVALGDASAYIILALILSCFFSPPSSFDPGPRPVPGNDRRARHARARIQSDAVAAPVHIRRDREL